MSHAPASPVGAQPVPVVVGLSGGVDSSVAALLLRRRGFSVTGLFMKNWEEDDRAGHCAAARDMDDARAVCERLAIGLRAVNFSGEYWERVFSHFLAEYEAGRTPNPDILCNREIKFGTFLDHALGMGAEYIATGHYARVTEQEGRYFLLKGRDAAKDQSYFLYTLGQRQLARTLFPLGELTKPQVRRLARDAALPTHAKRDSTGICFIGERNFRTFLARYLPGLPGTIVSVDGQALGQHGGLMHYTLGQRHGLSIGGRKGGDGNPWYVVRKDLKENILVVAQGRDNPLLYDDTLEAHQLHWVAGVPPELPCACRAKTRYRQVEQDCEISPIDDGRVRVTFARPQWAVTPGQSVVFYREQECLGGGIIERTGSRGGRE